MLDFIFYKHTVFQNIMQQFTYTIKDRDGVHARPAGAIIKAAHAYKSNIFIESNGKKIALKQGIFALMGLGIRCGAEVTVSCEGEDENEAAQGMQKCFNEYL